MNSPTPLHLAPAIHPPSSTNSTPTHLPRLLYSREEASYQWSISERGVDYLIAEGRVKVRRIGGRILIPRSELLRIANTDQREPITSSSSSPKKPVMSATEASQAAA
jgi:hypothetical protein